MSVQTGSGLATTRLAAADTSRNLGASPRHQSPRAIAGVQAEFFDFEDRSSGPVEIDDIVDTLAEGRFVWVDVDCEQAHPEVIAKLLPASGLAGFDPSSVGDAGCCEAEVSRLRRSEGLLQISLIGMVDGTDGLVGQTLHLLIAEGFLVSFNRGASAVLAEVRRD